MNAKILKIINLLQMALLPWEDDRPIEDEEWYCLPDEMEEMLPHFLEFAYEHGTTWTIKELAKWLTASVQTINQGNLTGETNQFADFWEDLYWESHTWLSWIREYMPEALPNETGQPKGTKLLVKLDASEALPDWWLQFPELATPEADSDFSRLMGIGLIEIKGFKYEWKGTKKELALCALLMSEKHHFEDKKWKVFETLFNTNGLAQANYKAKETDGKYSNRENEIKKALMKQ